MKYWILVKVLYNTRRFVMKKDERQQVCGDLWPTEWPPEEWLLTYCSCHALSCSSCGLLNCEKLKKKKKKAISYKNITSYYTLLSFLLLGCLSHHPHYAATPMVSSNPSFKTSSLQPQPKYKPFSLNQPRHSLFWCLSA